MWMKDVFSLFGDTMNLDDMGLPSSISEEFNMKE
jgi:hypothetical protein